MLKSMTGFGRFEATSKERKIVVEMKSVNHRYSDISVKLPKKLSSFDATIRNLLKDYISRGKVDVYVTYEDYSESNEFDLFEGLSKEQQVCFFEYNYIV